MNKLKAALNLLADETGATAVEYGIMLAAIAGVVIAVVFSLGLSVSDLFSALNFP
mgnify:CR=1 FL=1